MAAIPVEGTREEFAEFEQFVRDSTSTFCIRGVAEEMSVAALRKHFISGDSVPCRLAGVAGLAHQYCDPDPQKTKYRIGSTAREVLDPGADVVRRIFSFVRARV
jgi:hypothetical protein